MSMKNNSISRPLLTAVFVIAVFLCMTLVTLSGCDSNDDNASLPVNGSGTEMTAPADIDGSVTFTVKDADSEVPDTVPGIDETDPAEDGSGVTDDPSDSETVSGASDEAVDTESDSYLTGGSASDVREPAETEGNVSDRNADSSGKSETKNNSAPSDDYDDYDDIVGWNISGDGNIKLTVSLFGFSTDFNVPFSADVELMSDGLYFELTDLMGNQTTGDLYDGILTIERHGEQTSQTTLTDDEELVSALDRSLPHVVALSGIVYPFLLPDDTTTKEYDLPVNKIATYLLELYDRIYGTGQDGDGEGETEPTATEPEQAGNTPVISRDLLERLSQDEQTTVAIILAADPFDETVAVTFETVLNDLSITDILPDGLGGQLSSSELLSSLPVDATFTFVITLSPIYPDME